MCKTYIQTQIKDFQDIFKSKTNTLMLATIISFIFLNVLKLSIFNYFIIARHTFPIFEYKFVFTLLLVVILYPTLIKSKSRIPLLIFYTLQTVYIVINISYYMYFHNYLHFTNIISVFSEGLSAATHSAAPTSPKLLIAFIDTPVLIYIVARYSKLLAVAKKLRFIIRVAITVCLILLMLQETKNYSQNESFIQNINDRYKGESQIVERYGTLINNCINLYQNRNNAQLVSSFQYGKEQIEEDTLQDQPNFVIIQVESMDANVINQKHNGKYIAPFLNSLSNNSVFYPYMLSYHMGGGTSDAEFSIINSLQPLTYYPAIKISNYDYPNSMVKQLLQASYNTLAFHGNAGDFFNRDVAFPKMGFENFYDMNKMKMKNNGWGAPDGEVFDYTSNTLKKAEQPFFSYTITMSSHGPFTSVKNYYTNDSYNDLIDENVKNYFNSISYVDQSIEKFVEDINKNFKNTYIIIWGDHTPGIKDATEYKQASYIDGDKYFEFTPLFIITPDHKIYKEKKQVASFLDIAPTILNASGIGYSIKSDGVNLLKAPETNSKIPFKSGYFDRSDLFNNIKNIHTN